MRFGQDSDGNRSVDEPLPGFRCWTRAPRPLGLSADQAAHDPMERLLTIAWTERSRSSRTGIIDPLS